MNLTKSEYLLFLKHPAWLWLKKYDKTKLPPVDANTQAVFDAGNKLEKYAEQLFPGAERIGFDSYDEYQTLSYRTQQAISDGRKVLFQARFDADNLTCLTDVVEFTSEKTLNLYEIKSSTKVKPEHRYDLAFQKHVLELCGYTVNKVSVILVNNSYVRSGHINSQELFTITDITEDVETIRRATEIHIKDALAVAASPTIPDISPRFANHMNFLPDWLKIYRTLVALPENSIYDLALISPKLIRELEDLDILLMKDIPDDFNLSDKQRRQITSLNADKPVIDTVRIKEFLQAFSFPLYFFDYETCSDVIPPYDGVKPYQQVPCQYSLHILDEPGGDLRHTDYIHRTPDHPAQSLAEALKRDVGDTGSVIVWYANFETGRNKEMAEMLPEFSDFFHDLNSRTADLMIPFSEGMYVDPAFMGSASIKKVLPVLVPELSYKGLAVQEGLTAQRLWMQTVLEGRGTDVDAEKLFADLLAYCELDTLAMVKIYEYLQNIVVNK